jgi:cation transporter-like permease
MRSLIAAWLARWKRASPLARDIARVLALKAVALYVLWALFFSAPVAHRTGFAPDGVDAQLLATSPPAERTDARR